MSIKLAKSTIVVMSIITVSGAVSGTVLGIVYRNAHAKVYFNDQQYKDDEELIYERFLTQKEQGNTDYESSFTPVEVLQIGFMNLKYVDYVAEATGEIDVGAFGTQTVTSIKVHEDKSFYFESLSIGKASVAARYYSDGENITVYGEKKTLTKTEDNICHATYKNKTKSMTYDEYKVQYGGYIDQPTIYLFSSKTVLEGTTPVLTKNGNQYLVEATFGEAATESYKIQMQATSSLVDSVSPFEKVTIHCVLDQDLNIQSFRVDENYTTISFLVPVKCTAYLETSYYYDDISYPLDPEESYILRKEK